MQLVLLAVCALVAVAFLWRINGAGSEARPSRPAGATVKSLLTLIAILPIVMLVISVWNVVTPFSYRVMVDSFDNYRSPQSPPRGEPRTSNLPTDGGMGQKPSTSNVHAKPLSPLKFLKWDPEAVVRMRDRVTTEVTRNGVCFMDMIPPNTKTKFALSCWDPRGHNPWETYMVERNVCGFVPISELAGQAIYGYGTRGGLLHLADMSSKSRTMTQSFFTTNNSGVGNESSVLCEFYIQVSDGQAHQIAIDKEAEKSVYQFVVDIGVDECKFTLPDNQPFKWLWIAPVHCVDWQLQYSIAEGTTPVSSKGMLEEARKKLFGTSTGDNPNIAPLAVTVHVNDKEEALEKARLFGPEDIHSGPIKLRVNAPGDQKSHIKPAKIIVGYQL